jgi:hypothetical protein
LRKFTLVVLLCAGLGLAQTAKHKPAGKAAAHAASIATPDTVKWGDPPPVLTPGSQLAVLSGNPGGTGPYVVRLKLPDGYKIMPHFHPKVENVTVVSGELHVGMGDKLDEAGSKALPPGSFAAIPALMHHFAFAKGETVVQIHGMGPFVLTYVNPNDDPSKKK